MANEFVTRRGIISLGGVTFPYYSTTTAYTVTVDDYFIDCLSGTFSVALPNSSIGTAGKIFIVKNSGTGLITVDPFGGQTIDGLTTKNLSQNESICIINKGPNWTSFGGSGNSGNGTSGTSGYSGLDGTGGGGGITSLGNIGASPSSTGAKITGSILNLEPASANFGGVITTGTQTFAGNKTFNSDVKIKTIYYGQGTGTGYATNILISDNKLENSTVGGNIIIGKGSGAAITTGTRNVVVGENSLNINTTGTYNVAIGASVLGSNTTGFHNTAVGDSSLNNSGASWYNSAFGSTTLITGTGSGNTAIGAFSMGYGNAASAGGNTCIGAFTGLLLSTGSNNVIIGNNVGSAITTGIGNILIGNGTDASSSGNSFETVIGYALTGKGTNTAFIGGVNGVYNQSGGSGNSSPNWNATSDSRLKTNINNLPSGLSVICSLRPVEFDWINGNVPDIGFIAQEYGQVLPGQLREYTPNESEKELVGDDTVKAINQNLNPYLVKAIQELKAEIEQLKATIKSLQ